MTGAMICGFVTSAQLDDVFIILSLCETHAGAVAIDVTVSLGHIVPCGVCFIAGLTSRTRFHTMKMTG
jgi:hypothetical protein